MLTNLYRQLCVKEHNESQSISVCKGMPPPFWKSLPPFTPSKLEVFTHNNSFSPGNTYFWRKKFLTNKSSQPSPEHIQSPSWQLQQGDVDLAPDNLWSLRTTFIPLSSRITWMVNGPPLSPWQASFPEAIPHNMSSVTLRNHFRKKRGTFQQEIMNAVKERKRTTTC